MNKTYVVRAAKCAIVPILAGNLLFPCVAYATVRVDETELAQGENAVGGGLATLLDAALSMVDVRAEELYVDEDLAVSFNGGNDIENVNVAGSAKVDLSFSQKNEVEEVHAADKSDVTINATGNNEFEEVDAKDQANLTINVTGENAFEEIVGKDDANITIHGTDNPITDVVILGEDEEDTELSTERGTLTIDHVTIELEAEEAYVGSESGDVELCAARIVKGKNNKEAKIEVDKPSRKAERLGKTVVTAQALAKTDDNTSPIAPLAMAFAGVVAVATAWLHRRRQEA